MPDFDGISPSILLTANNPRARLLRWSFLVGILVLMPIVLGNYMQVNLALTFANAIGVLGLSFLLRYCGQKSIGHNFFLAVGAYVVALLQIQFGVPFPLTIIGAVACSLILGIMFAFPTRRLAGIYLAVATMALGLALPEVVLEASDVTGGYEGLYVQSLKMPGVSDGIIQYYMSLSVFVAVVACITRFRNSWQGRALFTARDNPAAAQTFGVSISWARLSAFGISAALTGLSGAVFAYVALAVSPSNFTFWTAIYLLVGSVISVYSLGMLGPLLGAAFITMLPNYFAGAGAWPPILFGLALTIAIVLAHSGSSIYSRILSWCRKPSDE